MSNYEKSTRDFTTIVDFLRWGLSKANAGNLFFGHGTDNAWDDIVALILGSLSLPFNIAPELWNATLTAEEKTLLCTRLQRRIEAKVPVPYLTQTAYFFGLPFFVDERVLIPRSPIAELINQQFSPWIQEHEVNRILDLGTGSGCIAIACCYAFPEAIVDAVDISADALEVAAVNRDHHHLNDTLSLIQSDCFDSVPNVCYDLIVSNPPYVGREEMETLPAEYTHEPLLALETGNNGLEIVERILWDAKNYLNPHGILVVEVGNSEDALVEAYPHVPFTWLDFEHGGQGVFLLTYEQLNEYFSREQ